MHHDPALLVRLVRDLVQDPKSILGENVVWVAGRVLGADSVVLLYREGSDGPVIGKHYVLPELASMFSPNVTTEELARIIFVDEITDPSGPGRHLDVDWADGLVSDPSAVTWWT
ncbi:conserved hypothetical protein [Frankia canadensis]|uniref:Uncharacterized protein n=1 Tax=Frankia canadensis TaxID=1836972 RepID=A0A2I2KZY0_9ACTN|nr:hypothetical protein [Frankia canadensis]SNQ51210.1 conserved hypothetical protein [Frankia canadensis]SOU58500.1 conserved hypothetical protein [Frankia canadensis]